MDVSADLGRFSSRAGRNYTFPFSPGKVGPPGLDIRRKEDQLIVHVFHPEVVVNGKSQGTMYGDGNTCYTFDYTVYVAHNRSGEVSASRSSSSKLAIGLSFVQAVLINRNEGTPFMGMQIRVMDHRFC